MKQKDYKLQLAEEVASEGCKEAMLEVFKHYINHEDKGLLAKNIELILRYLTAMAEDGDGYAMRHLGNLYNYGRGVEQDYKKAIEWFEKAADASDTYAMCNLGYIYCSGHGAAQDYAKAYKYIAKAAFLGNVNAMYKLGDMYYYGQHVKEDKDAAYFWYCEANEDYEYCHSYEQASIDYCLGKCFLYGHGVAQDNVKALQHLTYAKENLIEQIKDGDPYELAWLILPNVRKELDKTKSAIKQVAKILCE